MGNGLTKSDDITFPSSTAKGASSSLSYIPRYRSNSELLPHRIINNITKREEHPFIQSVCSPVKDYLETDIDVYIRQQNFLNDIDELDSTYQDIGEDEYDTSDVCYLNLEVDNRLFRINSENYSELYSKSNL